MRAASLMMEERPDLIVLGGDYVTWGDRSYVVPCSEALAGLAAPFGVYAVLGNHDDDRDMPAALISHGYEVLRDARTTLRIRGEQIGSCRRAFLDAARARHREVDSRRRSDGDPARARSAAARRSRRAWMCRSCCRDTHTAARWCCRVLAPSPRGNSQLSPAPAGVRTRRSSSVAGSALCMCLTG